MINRCNLNVIAGFQASIMFCLPFCWQELSPASLVFRQKHVEELISGVGICPEKLGYWAVKHPVVSPGLAMFGLSTWLSSLAAGIPWLHDQIELVEDGRNDADLYRTWFNINIFQGTTWDCWSYSLSHHKRTVNKQLFFLFQAELQPPRQDTPMPGKELIEARKIVGKKTRILLGKKFGQGLLGL